MTTGKLLLVDDDAAMCRMLAQDLGRRGHDVETCSSVDEAEALLLREDVDAVVTDLRMKGKSGLALCDFVVQHRPDVPVIVITGFGSMEAAVATLRAGAFDFLAKPFENETLAVAVERALHHHAMSRELARLRDEVEALATPEMLGESKAMAAVRDVLGRVAPSEATVLVTGESGTGKEVVARALHRGSPRARGPFVPINCAAMPEALLESELFGHVKGAFTDAQRERRGLFQDAKGGTLFLDEIGELPLALQPKLLRALEERAVRPVGGSQEVPFDARIIAATNRDLEEAVRAGTFREDLYYRVHVISVPLPPLRERGGDILLLAHAFVRRFAARSQKDVRGIAAAAAERLLAYAWPGNVRELANAMERAVVMARYDHVTVDDLPPKVRATSPSSSPIVGDDAGDLVTMDEVERRYVARVLASTGGNKNTAAKILGFDRKTLYRKLARWGVDDAEADE